MFCGNGRVDRNEECEPPETETCDESCMTIIPGGGFCGDNNVDEG